MAASKRLDCKMPKFEGVGISDSLFCPFNSTNPLSFKGEGDIGDEVDKQRTVRGQ